MSCLQAIGCDLVGAREGLLARRRPTHEVDVKTRVGASANESMTVAMKLLEPSEHFAVFELHPFTQRNLPHSYQR